MQLPIHSYQLIKTGRDGQKHSVRFGPGPNHPSIAKHNFPVPLFAHFACRFAFPFCPSTFTPLPPSVRCPSFCLVTEGQWLYGIMFKNYTFVYMYVHIYREKTSLRPTQQTPCEKRVGTKSDWKNVLALNQLGKFNFVYPIRMAESHQHQTSESSSNLAKSQA